MKKWIITILIISFIVSTTIVILVPKYRTGPFGIGLPSDMNIFNSQTFGFAIKYPASWVARELPNGNHDDQEIITMITIPGRSISLV
jgi:hypothetical protein